jgi:hypothetical protein
MIIAIEAINNKEINMLGFGAKPLSNFKHFTAITVLSVDIIVLRANSERQPK